MEVSNLEPSVLTQGQIKALAFCLPSFQCGPKTDELSFNQMWCKERVCVCQFSTSLIIPLSLAQAEEESKRITLLLTQIHPHQIDIPTLANTNNHFKKIQFEGRELVRVTCVVHSPETADSQSKWRVSDYNLEGQMITSVICTLKMDLEISSSEERWQSEPQVGTTTPEQGHREHHYFSYC